MPAELGQQLYGYLYLDKHVGGTPFAEDDLPLLRILCSQIAMGLANIVMYDEMKELKERYEEEASFYKQEMGVAAPLETIIGESEAITKVKNQIRQVAPADSLVLIEGETGVGKELIAKAIHSLSKRKEGPFIPVNIAALPEELVASELFGHEKGAFTGANERQKGRFELADGGTIFLDEIGDLPFNMQVKLLRVLQEGAFERLGSSKPIRSNFRVIAATNKNLLAEVNRGSFRRDLFYRLNVFPIYSPPLRERKEDIRLLMYHFIDKYNRKMGKGVTRVPTEETSRLLEYHWPGNVRELEHFIERAIIFSDGHRITFPRLDQGQLSQNSAENETSLMLRDMERSHIEKVLNMTRWRVSGPKGAAAVLGLKSTTLFYRMKILNITAPRGTKAETN
jgi:transcriptional regulator with GAF, ATPase, and Fis domain